MNIYSFTGNPFVDAGIAALTVLADKRTPEELTQKDLEKAADYVIDLYPKWVNFGKGFVKVFHNLSSFNFSVPREFRTPKETRMQYHRDKYMEFLKDLLTKVTRFSTNGSCIACGRRDAELLLQRDKHPLLGSGDIVNFFSFFEEGLGFCCSCTFAIQFVPLALMEVENKLYLVHSHDTRVLLNKQVGVVRRSVHHFHELKATGKEPEFYKPKNIKAKDIHEGAVKLAVDLIENSDELIGEISIRLYTFNNAGKYAGVRFIDLPSKVYGFISRTKQRGLSTNLNVLLKQSSWEIYYRLTEGESIRYFFIDRDEQKIRGGWELFELYLKEVEDMDKDKLQTVVSVANRIYDYIQRTNIKPLKEIEQANYTEFRRVLLSIHKIFSLCASEELPVILSFDDWNEKRDLLLFRIYECQHGSISFTVETNSDERRIRLQEKLSTEFQKRLQIADRIFDYCILHNHKNRLDEIEQANKYPEFRKALLAIQKETLICMADELPLLFPKDESGKIFWENVRDILLFRIYERKHQMLHTTT